MRTSIIFIKVHRRFGRRKTLCCRNWHRRDRSTSVPQPSVQIIFIRLFAALLLCGISDCKRISFGSFTHVVHLIYEETGFIIHKKYSRELRNRWIIFEMARSPWRHVAWSHQHHHRWCRKGIVRETARREANMFSARRTADKLRLSLVEWWSLSGIKKHFKIFIS